MKTTSDGGGAVRRADAFSLGANDGGANRFASLENENCNSFCGV